MHGKHQENFPPSYLTHYLPHFYVFSSLGRPADWTPTPYLSVALKWAPGDNHKLIKTTKIMRRFQALFLSSTAWAQLTRRRRFQLVLFIIIFFFSSGIFHFHVIGLFVFRCICCPCMRRQYCSQLYRRLCRYKSTITSECLDRGLPNLTCKQIRLVLSLLSYAGIYVG